MKNKKEMIDRLVSMKIDDMGVKGMIRYVEHSLLSTYQGYTFQALKKEYEDYFGEE